MGAGIVEVKHTVGTFPFGLRHRIVFATWKVFG